MLKRHLIIYPIMVALIIGFSPVMQSARAGWGGSFSYDSGNPYSSYYSDRIASEYRRGYQMDDWVERGASSVTESPVFSDGVRLAAWATRAEDDYDFGIASAIYYFDIPRNARSIKVKIYYDGRPDRDDLNNDMVGRVWIKRSSTASNIEEYDPTEGKYESVDKPLYGDSFVLPSKKHLEIIRISARDHIEDDIMELHVVAEGRQMVDVKYIEVESYSSEPSIRVITKYYKDYTWRPWYDYTYWYFYSGPIFYFSDYYYVRYTYPNYRRYYISMRSNYNDYLRIYYVSRPNYYVRWVDVVRVHKNSPREWNRERLNRWTANHDEVRRSYEVTSMKTRRTVEVQASRERIRGVLSTNNRQSPSAIKVRSNESVQVRGSAVTETKQRREIQSSRQIVTPEVRTETRVYERTPSQAEKREAAKNRREVESSTVRRNTTEKNKQESNVRSAPSRNEDNDSSKKRREVIREETKKEERKVEKAPKKEENTPKVEVKSNDKDDDDEDEDEDKKNSDSSSSRKRIRGR